MIRKTKEQQIASARRQVAGTIAKANGLKFEIEIETSCEYYRKCGYAVITRSHPKVAGPPGRMFYAGKGAVDFIGHANGVPIAFDAKSCSKDARSWAYPDRDLFQVKFLMDWKRCAGNHGPQPRAFVLLRQGGVVYRLDDLEALYRGESIILRDKQKPIRGGTEMAESPRKIQPYFIRSTEDCPWRFLGDPIRDQ